MYRSLIFVFFLLNSKKAYRDAYMMDQENDPNPHKQDTQNANANEQETQNPCEQERDCSNEINEGLQSLKDLSS